MGRFAAIAIISLLGAGFYGGLRMAAPDMRIAGDQFFDGTALFDISVMSTLGLDDDSLDTLRSVPGAGTVSGTHRADAMVHHGDSSYATTIESFDIESARASDTSDGVNAVSDNDAYQNRPILLEGTWPNGPTECVVSAYAAEKLGIKLGDELVVEKGVTDIDDTFAQKTFTVSGFVNSAQYASKTMLGTTTLGTGDVELYLFVDDAAFDGDLPYSAAYVSVPAAAGLTWSYPDYNEAVNQVKQGIDAVAQRIGDERWNSVRADAQKELDDARADYECERADAEKELADADAELASARAKLDSAAADVANGKQQLYASAADLADAKATLEKGEREYADGVAELAANRAEADKGFAAAQAQIDAARPAVEAGLAQLPALEAMLQDPTLPEEQRAAIEAQIAQIKAAAAELSAGQAALDAQKATAAAQFDAGQAKLDAARAELDAGWKQYRDGEAQYASGAAELYSGEAEYLNGEASYASGVAEFQDKKAEALQAFADAEQELADAQADIDAIERPEVYVMDRSKNPGAASLDSDADGIAQIASLFPFMFFLVAALVSLTSMTRMVDEERMIIGTHKALGYGKARITSKYLIYGALASGVGSVVGVVTLGKLLPWFIMTSYNISYAVPVFPTPLDPVVSAKAIGLSVGVTVVATWAAAASSLREKPAALLLPRVPKAGKRIVLERITPLWSRMSFSHKVTARNLLRYKRRFFMAVVGIAGCTALLMIGFGLRDAIGGIVQNQYERIICYDAVIRVDEDISAADYATVLDNLKTDDVDDFLEADELSLIAKGPDGQDMRIDVVVPIEQEKLGSFVDLHERESQKALSPAGTDIVLTEKAATTLGAAPGDTVQLYEENDIGDPTGDPHGFMVGGIAENYLGHYLYVMPEGFKAAFNQDAKTSVVFVKLAKGANAEAFGERMLNLPGVNTASFVADRVKAYEDMLDVMNKLIYIIVLAAAALAFVVLYNLTNINISERVREIATLKVLGFTKREVNAYIFREIMVMALIGAVIGCVLGVPLTFYIAQAAETSQMMFGRVIEPASFVAAFALTMAFSAIVAVSMRRKLARINMVESLKSVE